MMYGRKLFRGPACVAEERMNVRATEKSGLLACVR